SSGETPEPAGETPTLPKTRCPLCRESGDFELQFWPRFSSRPMGAAELLRALRHRSELHARLLHLTIRQQPNERFIVQIDDLDAVSPRVAEVAPKRRDQFDSIFLHQLPAHRRDLR